MVGVIGVAVRDGGVAVDGEASLAGGVVAVAGVAVQVWGAGGARFSARIVARCAAHHALMSSSMPLVSTSRIAWTSFLFLATMLALIRSSYLKLLNRKINP
jgi:hypothetical protein